MSPRRAVARGSVPVALALGLSLASCGPLDVRVAFLPDSGGGVHGVQCTKDAECNLGGTTNAYCDRPGCGLLGLCKQRPNTPCGAVMAPVCGCDDVTYFNDCLRRLAGTSLQGLDECQIPVTCDVHQGCTSPAICVRLGLTCGPRDGVCWVTPLSCPGALAYQDCADPGVCLDICQAAASGRPFGLAPSGTCP